MRVKFPPLDQVYLPHHVSIHQNRDRYLLLYGGRGGAKSTDAAKKLILRCLSERYFRYILLRKTYVSIKDSQYATIKSICKKWGVAHLFQFNTSPLEIRCHNGNSFIARGLDREDSTKSIDNPTGIWYEEANQITEEDFLASTTSIRTTQADYLQEILTFNPEGDGDYHDFWIVKRFFKDQTEYSFRSHIEVPYEDRLIAYDYTVIHSTHRNNPFLPDDYRAQLEQLQTIDPYYYQVFTMGKWGNKSNDSPFAFAYSADKHDGYPQRVEGETLYLSFDFNKNPISCSVMQLLDDGVNVELNVLRTIKLPNSDIYALCDYIKATYPDGLFMVTGDATGRNRSAMVKGNIHYYTIILQELGLSSMQIKVPNVNPPLKSNGLLVNAILATVRVQVHKKDAYHLLYDFKNVKRLADGSIEKGDRNNPAQQADAIDTFRYFCNTFMQPYVNLTMIP